MNPPGAVRIPPGAVHALNAIDYVYRRDGRVTILSAMRAAGLKSTSAMHYHVVRLRALGLVTWEPGRMGTLRPTVDRVDIDRDAIA